MYCAECGNKLIPHNMGTHLRCCNGWGYWWNQPPLTRDHWFGIPPCHEGWYFYKNCMMWPSEMKPVSPKLTD